MRIVFLHHVFQAGSGIEQVITDLCSRLRPMGHETYVITYESDYTLPIDNRITRSVLAPAFLGTNAHIRANLDRMEADVVVTSLYPMSIVPLWPHRVKAKVVFIEWGIQPYSAYKSPVDKAYLWLLNRADRYAIKHSDTVVVANKVTKRWVEKQGVQPIKLNLYGTNFDRLKPNTDFSFLNNKHKELLNADGIIMYAGRQSPHKNIDILIKAIGLLDKHERNVKLLVVGPESFPKYSAQLKLIVKKLGLENNVIFTGLVSEDDLMRYYSICDMFVNASSWEGYLIAEPYAFKKPIVAYNIAPHDETVQHGVTGLLCQELTPNSFALNIAKLLADQAERDSMGEAGYQWARENLDYNVIAQKFIDTVKK